MKLTKRNIIAFSGVFGIALIIILYLIFSDSTLCKAVEVSFVQDSMTYALDKEDVKTIVLNEYPELIGSPISMVNLSNLENIVKDHPSIKNVEVYKKIDGILAVDVEFRIPIVRVMPISGPNFYIDIDGKFMPVSKSGTARVMIANGNISFKYDKKPLTIDDDSLVTETLRDIWLISKIISEDNFLRAQTEQIYVTKETEYELIPKVGKHKVLLGDINNVEKKIKYLRHFYINVLNTEGWKTFKYFNLKYKGQIVCTKNEL